MATINAGDDADREDQSVFTSDPVRAQELRESGWRESAVLQFRGLNGQLWRFEPRTTDEAVLASGPAASADTGNRPPGSERHVAVVGVSTEEPASRSPAFARLGAAFLGVEPLQRVRLALLVAALLANAMVAAQMVAGSAGRPLVNLSLIGNVALAVFWVSSSLNERCRLITQFIDIAAIFVVVSGSNPPMNSVALIFATVLFRGAFGQLPAKLALAAGCWTAAQLALVVAWGYTPVPTMAAIQLVGMVIVIGVDNGLASYLEIDARRQAAGTRAGDRFRMLTESAKEGIAIADVQGSLQYLSPAAALLLGYRPEELVGTDGFALVYPDDVPIAAKGLAEVAASPGGANLRLEMRLRRKDGTAVPIEGEATNLLADPAVAGVVFTFRDISVDQRLEEAAQLARRQASEAHERVRREIAEVLHGTVQSGMAALSVRLVRAAGLAATDPGAASAAMLKAAEDLDSLRENDVRLATQILHPTVLKFGLSYGLRALMSVAPNDDLPVRFTCSDAFLELDGQPESGLPFELRLTAYRITEEALANVRWHARGTSATVDVSVTDGRELVLAITDDGQGFQPETTAWGVGLSLIDARVRDSNGRWELVSTPGSGTTVRAWLPL